jgi:hypothetical protein
MTSPGNEVLSKCGVYFSYSTPISQNMPSLSLSFCLFDQHAKLRGSPDNFEVRMKRFIHDEFQWRFIKETWPIKCSKTN